MMHLYNNVAKLRQVAGNNKLIFMLANSRTSLRTRFRSRERLPQLIGRTDHLDIQIADLLAQRIAIDAQKIGRPYLVPTGGSKGR